MNVRTIVGATVFGIATLPLARCTRTPEPPYRQITCFENARNLRDFAYYCEDSRTGSTYLDFGPDGKLDILCRQEKGTDKKCTWIYDRNSTREDMFPEYRNEMFPRGSEDADRLQKEFATVKTAFAEQEAEIAERYKKSQ